MSASPTEHPGIREQHLLRKQGNPLFDERKRQPQPEDLQKARLEDDLECDRFMAHFRELVQNAVDLKPNAESETVLEIKEDLDRSYQQACALPGDQSGVKDAITKLLAVIMQAVWAGVGNDEYAQQQLRDEELARKAHFDFQENALVAALTHEDSPIAEDELIPALLSEPPDSLQKAIRIFDEIQIAAIYNDAGSFLAEKDPARELVDAWQNLEQIEAYYRALQPQARAD